MKLKRTIDAVLFMLLMMLMAYSFMESWMHELLGIIMIFLVLLHEIVNRKWFRSLFKGNYSLTRKVFAVINFCLIIGIVLAFVSGLSMSEFISIFDFIPVGLARRIHMVSVHWVFVFMALHLGMHFKAIVTSLHLKISKQSEIVQVVFNDLIYYLVIGVGILCFIKNRMIAYLFMLTDFVYFSEANIVQYVLEYFMIFISFAMSMSLILSNLLKRRKDDEIVK